MPKGIIYQKGTLYTETTITTDNYNRSDKLPQQMVAFT
jgi:hypothetical protein